nr:uncharacterized protein LOC129382727 isoform X2 [Dermacentor andersoni]
MTNSPKLLLQATCSWALCCGLLSSCPPDFGFLLLPWPHAASPAPILDGFSYRVWQQGTATLCTTGGAYKSLRDIGGFGHGTASEMTNSPKLLLQATCSWALCCGLLSSCPPDFGFLLLPWPHAASPAPILDGFSYRVWQQGTATLCTTGAGYKSLRDIGGFGHGTASEMTNSPKLLLQATCSWALCCGLLSSCPPDFGFLLLPWPHAASPAPISDGFSYRVWQQGTATLCTTSGGYKSHRDIGGFGHGTASEMTNSPKLLLQKTTYGYSSWAERCQKTVSMHSGTH